MLSALTMFAQYSNDFNSSYSRSSEPNAAGVVFMIMLFSAIFIFIVALYVFIAVCLMKIFKKAGRQDAWAAWIPIYNTYVYYEISGKPGWWAFLGLIPFAGGIIALVLDIIASLDLAKAFGKSEGFGVLLALLPIVGYPMLAFSDAQYSAEALPDNSNAATPPAAS